MIKKKTRKVAPKKHSDLVGIDFSTTATKVVRLKKDSKGKLSLTGVDMLPAVDFSQPAARFELPRNITSHYGCMAYTGQKAIVRLINTELDADEDMPSEEMLRGLLNVSDDFRVSAQLVRRGKGRQDSSLLAAAVPQDDVRQLLAMFPAGPPAPASMEVSGLSFVSAFIHGYGKEARESAVGLIEAGETVSHFVFLNKGTVVLVGKIPFGARVLREKISTDLGVDDELAASILEDRSINISSSLAGVMDPFIKQLTISRDFVERHQGCRVSKVYISGGLSLLPAWVEDTGQMLEVDLEPWDPFEGVECEDDLFPEELANQRTRFAAAVGAAIGGFEGT